MNKFCYDKLILTLLFKELKEEESAGQPSFSTKTKTQKFKRNYQ